MEYSPTLNVIASIMAIIPWGVIPYGNIPLQRVGIAVQIIGTVLMIGNFALLFF